MRRYVELDNRRRVPLARFARPQDSLFIAEVDDLDVITLTPAIVVKAPSGTGDTCPAVLHEQS